MNLTARVDVNAPPETVFAAATDWERQGEWILGTTVRVRRGDGRSVGSEVEAVTGLRGTGIFAVQPRAGGGATFEWTEQLELPLGALGRLGWPLVRPIFGWGLQRSLDRFAGFCQDYLR